MLRGIGGHAKSLEPEWAMHEGGTVLALSMGRSCQISTWGNFDSEGLLWSFRDI